MCALSSAGCCGFACQHRKIKQRRYCDLLLSAVAKPRDWCVNKYPRQNVKELLLKINCHQKLGILSLYLCFSLFWNLSYIPIFYFKFEQINGLKGLPRILMKEYIIGYWWKKKEKNKSYKMRGLSHMPKFSE